MRRQLTRKVLAICRLMCQLQILINMGSPILENSEVPHCILKKLEELVQVQSLSDTI